MLKNDSIVKISDVFSVSKDIYSLSSMNWQLKHGHRIYAYAVKNSKYMVPILLKNMIY